MTASSAARDLSQPPARFRQIMQASCRELQDTTTDFFTKYFALHHLRGAAAADPALIDEGTIALIQQVFADERFDRQRQSLFFFRQAAEVLTTLLTHTARRGLAARVLAALKQVALTTSGNGHRAAVEAIGSLPATVVGPRLARHPIGTVPRFDWQQLLNLSGVSRRTLPSAVGRSLVAPVAGEDRLLVVKLAKKEAAPGQLVRELDWMRYLHQRHDQFRVSFRIPQPLELGEIQLFKLTCLPVALPADIGLDPQLTAIGFLAPRDYFAYPNASAPEHRPGPDQLRTIMHANAFLLANLASRGIVHTAPIALFHNRIQAERRRDRGCYEWFRAGRLDRWLASCEYPNMGVTGIRDFEHLASFKGDSRKLYRHIGDHLMGLLLVAGSYFRNKAPHLRGLNSCGKPVDTRYLFDRRLFAAVIEDIFSGYYEGFVGTALMEGLPLDLEQLTARLIDEMGVDRHMEEVLRVADQDQMSTAFFRRYLSQRGHPNEDVPKGVADVVIHTGPHLGGFNRPISVPELIEAVGTMSAWCIAGRFWRRKFG